MSCIAKLIVNPFHTTLSFSSTPENIRKPLTILKGCLKSFSQKNVVTSQCEVIFKRISKEYSNDSLSRLDAIQSSLAKIFNNKQLNYVIIAKFSINFLRDKCYELSTTISGYSDVFIVLEIKVDEIFPSA